MFSHLCMCASIPLSMSPKYTTLAPLIISSIGTNTTLSYHLPFPILANLATNFSSSLNHSHLNNHQTVDFGLLDQQQSELYSKASLTTIQ